MNFEDAFVIYQDPQSRAWLIRSVDFGGGGTFSHDYPPKAAATEGARLYFKRAQVTVR